MNVATKPMIWAFRNFSEKKNTEIGLLRGKYDDRRRDKVKNENVGWRRMPLLRFKSYLSLPCSWLVLQTLWQNGEGEGMLRVVKPKQKTHSGRSFGECKVCGNQFKLKRKTKHSHLKILSGVICSKCGKPNPSTQKKEEKV